MKQFYIIGLTLILILSTAGCDNSTEEAAQEPNIAVSRIETNLDLKKGESEKLCYTDGKVMVFVVETELDVGIKTNRIVLYDMEEKKIKKEYQIEKEIYTQGAVPYKDGILYFAYDQSKEPVDEPLWEITYLSKSERKVLDKGRANYFASPSLTRFGETIYYTYMDIGSGQNTMQSGIRKIEGEKILSVKADPEYGFWIRKVGPDAYLISAASMNTDTVEMFIGTSEGIEELSKVDSKGGYNVAMNNKYLMYTLNGDDTKLTAMDLKTKDTFTCDTDLLEFSIVGLGDYFFLQDKSNNQYYIKPGDKMELKALELPEDLRYKVPLKYAMQIDDDSMVLQTTRATGERGGYYLLELK